MTDASTSNRVLLTLNDIRQWEESLRALTVEIDELSEKRAAIVERIEFARLLFPDAVEVPPATVTKAVAPTESSSPTQSRKEGRPSVLIPWETAIIQFVSKFDRGCSYAELRAHLLASDLGDDLRKSTKSYERSIRRLAGGGVIERGYGRVFTPEAFVAFEMEAKESGVPPTNQPFTRSPMGEAVLRIIHAQPGLRNKQVIAELRKDVELDAALTPNEGTAHNIIARLARRQNIVKRDDGGAYPGPNFPYDLLGLSAQRERTPSSDAAGVRPAEEGATSSVDDRQGFRLVG